MCVWEVSRFALVKRRLGAQGKTLARVRANRFLCTGFDTSALVGPTDGLDAGEAA